VRNLRLLVEYNLGFHFFRAVEKVKRALTSQMQAAFEFDAGGIQIQEAVSREEFERWTEPLRQRILEAAGRAVAASGGRTPDAVFLTGGTSYIPSVREMFCDRFGAERVRDGDALTSVAAGLGRAACAAMLRA